MLVLAHRGEGVDVKNSFIDMITSYSNKKDGWLGPGSKGISKRVIQDALKFFNALPFVAQSPNSITSHGDDELVFKWETPSGLAIASVEGEGVFHLFLQLGSKRFYLDDEEIPSTGVFDAKNQAITAMIKIFEAL